MAGLLELLSQVAVPATTQAPQRNTLPQPPQQALRHASEAERGPELMSQGEFANRNEVDIAEMPLSPGDIQGLLKVVGRVPQSATGRTLRSAREKFQPSAFEGIEGFKSRSKIVEMNIDEFLNLALPMTPGTGSPVAGEVLARGDQLSTIPRLSTTSNGTLSRVVGHEGRNRARALREQGFDTMPVEIRDEHIRFSEQADPENFDFVKDFPARLGSEGGGFEALFPISRGDPAVKPLSPLLEQARKNRLEVEKFLGNP